MPGVQLQAALLPPNRLTHPRGVLRAASLGPNPIPSDKSPPSSDHQTTCAHQLDDSVRAETDRHVGKVDLKSDRLLARGAQVAPKLLDEPA